jgi:hypothetical protein
MQAMVANISSCRWGVRRPDAHQARNSGMASAGPKKRPHAAGEPIAVKIIGEMQDGIRSIERPSFLLPFS